ncbi:MAG: helix-turn-helix domain-containing protein [Fibromonadaceae bacterium]|jgi:excisionase family DNA binding protein|nr:helix-turn-helix domain-containing protein [Fibromonadaceae bacterium]
METLEKEKQEHKANGRDVKTVAGAEYWTSKKAARYLGVSKVTLHNYTRRKQITQLNFGSSVLYKQEWLDEFINERTLNGYANRTK